MDRLRQRMIAGDLRAIGVDQPLDPRRVLAQPFVLCRDFREEALQFRLHVPAQSPLITFSREILGIEGNAHPAGVGGGIFTGVQHRSFHLTRERQQWMALGRVGGPARIELVDGVEDHAAEGNGVDSATLSPVRLGHLDVPGAAGDGQPAPRCRDRGGRRADRSAPG